MYDEMLFAVCAGTRWCSGQAMRPVSRLGYRWGQLTSSCAICIAQHKENQSFLSKHNVPDTNIIAVQPTLSLRCLQHWHAALVFFGSMHTANYVMSTTLG